MISSIQLRENVKLQLARYKERNNESFEEVIVRMMQQIEKQKRQQKALLIEGYKEMAEESLKMQKEFDAIDEDFDWEWK